VIFSTTHREHGDYVAKLADGALGRYEAYLSHEIGDMKPHASAFELVAVRAAIEPKRALFIDDLAENVAAARAVGFRGHIFTGRAAFEQLLSSVGILT
jgi:FMN phosphatase YigB (HAD superfamily)